MRSRHVDSDPWQSFKDNPNPLAKVRELKRSLPDGPGLPALYQEVKEAGSVLGVPILRAGRNIFFSRKAMVERVEGGASEVESGKRDAACASDNTCVQDRPPASG